MYRPFAELMRPRDLDEVVGQKELIGERGILRSLVTRGALPNMIFYGPSGVGKTTVAGILAKTTNRRLHRLNATTAGTSDIKAIISELNTLLTPQGVLLYLDEIQYFNKKQQQSLLDFIEDGRITLIASTTENPYFYVYNAILSRCTVFEFKPLSPEDLTPLVHRAFEQAGNNLNRKFTPEDGVCEYIARSSGGDARKAINAVELATLSAEPENDLITLESCRMVAQKSALRYDRDGDEHYDILSAFQKSIRGSDPDAAVHYLARLLAAGDMVSPCRRLLVIASEDIGLAYPQAVAIVKACVDSAREIGLPEAMLPLSNAALLLATAPKSNTAATAISLALADVQNGVNGDIPSYLKDGHYEGAKNLGRAQGYKYPHDYENNYIPQKYLPDNLSEKKYYKPGNNKHENYAYEYWKKIKGE